MMAAISAGVASDVPFDIFAAYGSIVNIPIEDATSATTTTTWTLDPGFPTTVPYDIPDGTPLGLASASQIDPVGFAVQGDWTIPTGQNHIAGVTIVASDPGANGSGLDQTVRLDALNYIGTITTDSPTVGGKDAELTSDFVERLTKELEVWTLTPILGKDFALIVQLLVPGVYRCASLDNYNPADGTTNNEKMVAICPIDANGAAVSSSVQLACQTLLESLREWNFVCNVVSPIVTPINFAYNYFVDDTSQYTAATADTEAALAAYINPATWGDPNTGTGLVPGWKDIVTVRHNKVVAVLESPVEVNYVSGVTMDTGAGGTGGDIIMPGPFALPQLGTITPTPGVGV